MGLVRSGSVALISCFNFFNTFSPLHPVLALPIAKLEHFLKSIRANHLGRRNICLNLDNFLQLVGELFQ